jgi:hypothetical protein
MNFAYVHLAVNHLPIVGTGIALLLLLVGFFRKDDGVLRAGLLVVLVSGLAAVPAVQSGERAEEQLEHVVALEESVVESHEEAAEATQWLALAAAFLAILTYVAMVRPGALQKWSGWLTFAVLLVAAAVFATVLRTAQTGGHIRHPETQGGIWQDTVDPLEELGEEDEDR